MNGLAAMQVYRQLAEVRQDAVDRRVARGAGAAVDPAPALAVSVRRLFRRGLHRARVRLATRLPSRRRRGVGAV